jgi:hypothetical protein
MPVRRPVEQPERDRDERESVPDLDADRLRLAVADPDAHHDVSVAHPDPDNRQPHADGARHGVRFRFAHRLRQPVGEPVGQLVKRRPVGQRLG